jgi:hypothetical protein
MERLQPETLDERSTHEWLTLTDEVLQSRAEPSCCGSNATLTAAVEREPQSPVAPAYRLWIADNLVRDGRLDDALTAYDAAIDCAQSAPRLFETVDQTVDALFQKAQAAAMSGAASTAIATYQELGQVTADDARPLFLAGELADERGDGERAAELYGRVARNRPSSRTDDHREFARRALLRLETPPADFAPSAERVVELLASALERRDASRLRSLASRTHFAAGPLGGHGGFEADDLLDELCRDLAVSSVDVRRRLVGSGDKRYLPTRGWAGKWFQGDVVFMITRAPTGWRWTGLGIATPNELWLERWRPAVERQNQPLPFPLLAPWPVDQSFMAGGLTEYARIALVGINPLAALKYARRPCGFGPRGFYYHQMTHDGHDAFAIDFTRYRQYLPFDNESGGTPVLAARGGVVSDRVWGFQSGYSGPQGNLVYIKHADPANPADQERWTSHYLHLEGPFDIRVSVGMRVITGTRLGRMDDTGNSWLDHLHFSIHDRNIGGSVRPTPMSGVQLEDGDSGTCVRSTNIEYPGDKPMIEPSDYAGQNWLITPAAAAVGETAPTSVQDQTWLLVLSGIAIVNLKGVTTSQWLEETVLLRPDPSEALQHAIARYAIPTPPGTDGLNFSTWFQVEQCAPFAALSSVFNQNESVNSGFAVNVWRPNPLETAPLPRDAFSNAPLDRLFNGIQADVAVRDSDAWIYRLSYHMTLLGKIVFSHIIIA